MKRGIWTFLFFFLAQTLFISADICMAGEVYRGKRVLANDRYEFSDKETVDFTIEQGVVTSVKVLVDGASKAITFSSCKDLREDGSSFTKWFAIECRNMSSFDDTPVSYEYFLIGGYAGISPEIKPGYVLYDAIKAASEQLGVEVPSRTFVIYANKKPVYEFFCYPESNGAEPKTK